MLKLQAITDLRRAHHQSVLLFLTDRCPVGCAHCSVDSLRTSPTITDYPRFEEVVAGICDLDRVRLVGISGGEPFIEKKALTLASTRITAAGKHIVLYTSGVWASGTVPTWAREVIARASSVFLSTDAQHAQQLSGEAFVRAARTVVDEGAGLVVQVIQEPSMVAAAERLLERAFGDVWRERAELSLTRALSYGRGSAVFPRRAALTQGMDFGPCEALASPVVRYDGRMTACCNERVITGSGPSLLHERVNHAADVQAGLGKWSRDGLLSGIENLGYGPMTALPVLADLQDQKYADICELCWKALPRFSGERGRSDVLLQAISSIVKEKDE